MFMLVYAGFRLSKCGCADDQWCGDVFQVGATGNALIWTLTVFIYLEFIANSYYYILHDLTIHLFHILLPYYHNTAPGSDAQLYLHDADGVAINQTTTLNFGALSSTEFNELYLMVNNTGFHVGFNGSEPFISMSDDTIDMVSITSVTLVGLGECSCDSDPPCDNDVIASEWVV